MYQNHLQILATHRHVVLMQFVRNETGWVLVHVCQNTLVIRTLAVGQNACQIPTATVTKLVLTIDVKIHVLAHVELMLNVEP